MPNPDRTAGGAGTGRTQAMTRYTLATLGGLLVNVVLFGIMQALIAPGGAVEIGKNARPVFEFLRLRREENTETKTRRAPERKPSKPTVASAPLSITNSAGGKPELAILNSNAAGPGFALSGRPTLGGVAGGTGSGSGSDTDTIPLVRVNPLYPPRAQARGVEGWVLVEFTISPQGTTKEVIVIDADPKGYFERAAVNAVKKYRYKPRIEDGVAVDRPGIRLVISFAIEE